MRSPSALAHKGERERAKRRVENKQSICMGHGYICRQGGETSRWLQYTTPRYHSIYTYYIYIYKPFAADSQAAATATDTVPIYSVLPTLSGTLKNRLSLSSLFSAMCGGVRCDFTPPDHIHNETPLARSSETCETSSPCRRVFNYMFLNTHVNASGAELGCACTYKYIYIWYNPVRAPVSP